MAFTDSDPRAAGADVELRLPADGAYVSVLRTTTAGLAARLDFTIDDIEDLRIAVGEACALVLPEADPGATLECHFRVLPGELTITVAVSSSAPAAADPDSFAWQVLTTLASSAAVDATAGRFAVTMTMRSSLHLGQPDSDA
ncbi:ATP-binding protein [Nocardioides dongkuii]|uniref:ATP-binding protein n=1 Tax=Nocardioides dongkuii TaxID=2760089 RepID=UPI0015FAC180|nr:anti-sigma factor [Nocardioides dongkuii]